MAPLNLHSLMSTRAMPQFFGMAVAESERLVREKFPPCSLPIKSPGATEMLRMIRCTTLNFSVSRAYFGNMRGHTQVGQHWCGTVLNRKESFDSDGTAFAKRAQKLNSAT